MKPTIRQKREEAQDIMKKHLWIKWMVQSITTTGVPKHETLQSIIQETSESVERAHKYNQLMDVPVVPLKSYWVKAKELAKLFKLQPKGSHIDLTGTKKGALNILKPTGYVNCTTGNYSALWMCMCDCGNDVVVTAHNLSRSAYYCGVSNCEYRKMPMKDRKVRVRLREPAPPEPEPPVLTPQDYSKEMAASILNSLTEHKLH